MFNVYLITNKINGKRYVGVTTKTLKERWYHHKTQNYCRHLHNAILKYGADNFNMEVICCAFSQKDMFDLERYFIEYYNTLSPLGYNLNTGGLGGCVSSEETKIKCGITSKKNWEKVGRKEYYSAINKEMWKNPEIRESRSKGIKKYIEDKKTPLISVDIYTKEQKIYPTINSIELDGYKIGNVCQCLREETIYAYNKCWFYYEEGVDYHQKSSDYLKTKGFYDHLPIIALNKHTNERLHFNNIKEINNPSWLEKCIRLCLRGKRKSYKGYIWSFNNS